MEENRFVIGVMSGTSLDGVDLCYVRFSKSNISDFSILQATTIPYSKERKKALQDAFFANTEALNALDTSYGKWLGEMIVSFIQKNGIQKVDCIASHGHTVHHRPEEGYTLQIGCGESISKTTGITTVCDFRTQDVQLGGQGAPLVPIGDQLLFSEYDACLNLGGFANISMQVNGKRIAYDICPVNVMLNRWAQQLGALYDKNGQMARKGVMSSDLLKSLESIQFYSEEPPKSLGIEFVENTVMPIINNKTLSPHDLLSTWIEHCALRISAELPAHKSHRTLITGGGAFNTYLIERLKEKTTHQLFIPNALLVNYKEALIFALLGLLKITGKDNCLASVTGAEKDHSSGKIYIT
ncbi:MAG: anhydro-N-acetylmuramic acid kinase [Flavobacteriaceae bacterium]|nr:anhydro-N-acetylmuramic acid kinase [Flavobacteriaceae bacterium]MDG2314083.1 anhydro-N-acetylmuramic acid kinase [Flavobacteriaceae bacterium]